MTIISHLQVGWFSDHLSGKEILIWRLCILLLKQAHWRKPTTALTFLCAHFAAIWHPNGRNIRSSLFIFQHQIRKMTSFIYSSYPMTCLIPNTSLQGTLLALHISSCLTFAFFYGIQLKGRKFKAVHW